MAYRFGRTHCYCLVNHDTASKNHHAIFFGEGYRQFLPVHQVGADRVSPTHVAPYIAEGVVLEKQMILAFKEDQPVWVVRPVLARGKMELWPVGLVVGGRLGGGAEAEEEEGCEAAHDTSQFGTGGARGRGVGLSYEQRSIM